MQPTAPQQSPVPFADPTPLGLIGLAVGCASLTPLAFGVQLSPSGLETTAMFCLLFGGGGQLLAGLMAFANRNVHGGTLLTAFSFNWFMNGWALLRLGSGVVPDHTVVMATDVVFLLVFLGVTWAFLPFGPWLVALLVDVDVLYACRVVAAATGIKALGPVIAVCTVALALIALRIAYAGLVSGPPAAPASERSGG